MAKPSTSVNSAVDCCSPDNHLGLSRVGRRYVQVLSDQQKLLDDPFAWDAGGVPNVPPRVLEDVKACYIKETKLATRRRKEGLSSQPASPGPVERAATQLHSSPPVPSDKHTPTQSKAKEDDDNEAVASGTPIPWTPSPPSHLLPANRQHELAMATRTPNRHLPQQAGPPLTAGNHSSRTGFLTDFPPSSSQASETVLEVEVPRAITDVIEPVNRQAVHVLDPTPPSAQIIPSTIVEETNPVQRPEATRRRRMKNPAAVFAELDSVGQSPAPKLTVPKAGTMASSRSANLLVTSSLPAPKPPAPKPPAPKSPAPKPPARHAKETSPVGLSVEDRHHSTAVHQSVVTTTPQPVSNEGVSSFADKVPSNSPPSQLPFIAFKLAYPDYQGTLNDFIRAVKCVLKYQKDRALPEFLYDDFIRVFCSDYLSYIRSLAEEQDACPALRWYNENVSKPRYVSGIIDKKNLTEIPNQYPEKFRAIQQGPAASGTRSHAVGTRHIGQRPAVGTETTPVLPPNDLTSTAASLDAEVPTHKAAFSSNTTPIAESPRPMQDSHEALSRTDSNADVPGFPPARRRDSRAERIGKVPGNTTSSRGFPQSQVDSSFPVTETPQAPRVADIKGKAASTLPSTMLSQISNPDSIPEIATKRKPAPRAFTGSSAGEAGSVFKRPRKTTEDSEKQELRWKKFLMQKYPQGSTPKSSKQT
ncbi:hypothetical protein C8A03DRAFT_11117 [Achaetomium macrosporum]|uniref:Uncharacterized protein n=1 Tax=Achaetomium macrosporum TaxID=79813 RepID=A0AAN7CIF0_9PEZI|nr:hypothetical protein C8A03DRAFT_11117 [Achaetomium macrosporum]